MPPTYTPNFSLYLVDPTGPSWAEITDDWREDSMFRLSRGLDPVQPGLPPRASDASFNLDNVAGTYDPPTNPVGQGKYVQAYWGKDATMFPLWYGVVDKPKHKPMLGQESIDIPCVGPFTRLTGKPPLGHGPLSTAVYILNRTDEILEIILDAINWPADLRLLDEGEVILAYWWAEGKDPWTAMLEIINAEGPTACAYEDADGNFVFKNSLFATEDTRANTSQATLSDEVGAAIQIARPFDYDNGQDHVVNYARWEQQTRIIEGSDSVVWSHPDEVVLGPNETIVFGVSTTTGDPFTSTIALDEGTDYVITGGSLTDISLGRLSGQVVPLTITAGLGGCVLEFVQVRAYLMPVTTTTIYVNTTGSPLDTGIVQQPFVGPTYPGVFEEFIISNINNMVAMWSSGRPIVTVTLVTINGDVLDQQIAREIYDRVTVVETKLGIDEDFWIAAIKHEIGPGNLITTTYTCVKCITAEPPDPPSTVGVGLPIFGLELEPTGVLDATEGVVTFGDSVLVNDTGVEYFAAAFKNIPGIFKAGYYDGDDEADQSITGPGFEPAVVMVFPDSGDNNSFWHGPGSDEDTGQRFNGVDGGAANRFVSMDAMGFTVGSVLNDLGTRYYYIAVKEFSEYFEAVEYVGDGTSAREITGAGFNPDLALVQTRLGDGLTAVMAARFYDNVGDSSALVTAVDFASTLISAFVADGIEIGDSDYVNKLDDTYQALFWKMTAGLLDEDFWTGNGTEIEITFDFQPVFILVKGGANNAFVWFGVT